jgi:hypothetical protein
MNSGCDDGVRPFTIGLDFDQTITLDPDFWRAFVALAKSHGHKVAIVTARQETEENALECDMPDALVYMTSGSGKRWYMEQKGIKVDVWVDDSPEAIIHGR